MTRDEARRMAANIAFLFAIREAAHVDRVAGQ
jgi:hypothetical protein